MLTDATIGLIDVILRAGGVALLLTQAGMLWRDAREVRPARFGILLAIAVAAVMAVESIRGYALPPFMIALLLPLNSNAAIAIWWFGLSLFDDDFRLGVREWLLAAVWFGVGTLNFADIAGGRPVSVEWASWARGAMAVGFVAHVVYVALAGEKTDLVERRRQVRIGFAFAIAGLFLIDLTGEAAFGYLNAPAWIIATQHATYLAVIVWSCFWLARIDKSVLYFDRPQGDAAPATRPTLSARESKIHARLIAVMEGEKAFLDPDLSIGALAERISAPEHQLRALINTVMGHRNFRAFLNDYRIAAVKRDLADPDKAALPILTIAMDAGFASLSSFNRAFREQTGKTPSAWRDEAFARPADTQI